MKPGRSPRVEAGAVTAEAEAEAEAVFEDLATKYPELLI